MRFFSIAAIVLTALLVESQVPTGFPSCAVNCVNTPCPMQTLDCICINVTYIGNCIGTNCSSADAAAAAPFIGFCYLSGTPTFVSQTPIVTVTASTSSSTTPAHLSTSIGGGGGSIATANTAAASSSGVSSSGTVAIGNGHLAEVLALAGAMVVAGFVVL